MTINIFTYSEIWYFAKVIELVFNIYTDKEINANGLQCKNDQVSNTNVYFSLIISVTFRWHFEAGNVIENENLFTISVDVEKAKNTLGIFHDRKWKRNKRIIIIKFY